MLSKRITKHPVIKIPKRSEIEFYWNKTQLVALKGETISSALFANGIHIFGHHHKDGSPQGIFCANGQCSQCMVLANDITVKSCMTKIESQMVIKPLEGLPTVTNPEKPLEIDNNSVHKIQVLIIGGGPAGLSAAIELGKLNIKTIIIDDKDCLGGKLVLQTHKFFGSVEDSYAGTRGFQIGNILEKKLRRLNSIDVWLNSTAVGVFSDKIVGVIKDGKYKLIKPDKLLVATGAREKMLSFPGNTLPGVYGAGAFQTLVNRDLVQSSDKVIIVGGGNVGLIAAYHALQAGIEVVALVEAMETTGGYKVHSDKIIRMGVPIFTRHTVVSATGKNHVEQVTIAMLDDNLEIINSSYKTFDLDTILVAVGLTEVNEFYLKAKQWGMDVYAAGDAKEIAEASSAMFTGKIEAIKIAKDLNIYDGEIPIDWNKKALILKSKPGKNIQRKPVINGNGILPVFHCFQEVPCNPCTSICPEGAIQISDNNINGLPYLINNSLCKGCMACVAICPGLAITLVDYRKNSEAPTITLPHEAFGNDIKEGNNLTLTDVEGNFLGQEKIKRIRTIKKYPGTLLIQMQIKKDIAKKVAGIKIQKENNNFSKVYEQLPLLDEAIICRCERITAGEIRSIIRTGVTDLNHMKAINRLGMGSCGSKTCRPMVWRLFHEEGIDLNKITDRVDRPLFVEVSMGTLAGIKGKINEA